jgi:DNA-binding response OmpR family regulator
MSANNGKLVVIIEDDRDILDLIDYILTDEGFTVRGYTHLERLEKIIDPQPSIILLDVRLADGSGDVLCKSIKNNPNTSQIPVVLISAHMALEEMAIACKADAYIAKPFNLTELVDTVNKFTAKSAFIIN